MGLPHQFAKALHVAGLRGWTHFVSMQNHYNLVYRPRASGLKSFRAAKTAKNLGGGAGGRSLVAVSG